MKKLPEMLRELRGLLSLYRFSLHSTASRLLAELVIASLLI
jgi:hypothetical protein